MKKRKILLISDHQLSTSGVGTQSRYLVNGLVNTGKYSFRCFGAAIKHENLNPVKVNDDFIILPVNGFGSKEMIRMAIAQEEPDAIMLFTDPRFFIWLWEMEDEIHQTCPIVYWHLWDELPAPEFNKVLYESTDLINCINYPTYQFCNEWFPEKTNFIPHALPSEVFHPISKMEALKFKRELLRGRPDDEFVALWVGRNARRKMPGDILVSFKMFLDKLQAKHGHKKATLVMHTDPFDQEGPNLFHQMEVLGIKDKIVFSKERIDFKHMNTLYNVADVCINKSCNEGFGLPMLEAMYCGKPIIAIQTGGLTRQVIDHRDGSQNGIGLKPEFMSLVGSQLVPYIYEAHVSNETYSDALMQMYEMGPEEREKLGQKAREYALEEFNIDKVIKNWDTTLENTIQTWRERYKPWECKKL